MRKFQPLSSSGRTIRVDSSTDLSTTVSPLESGMIRVLGGFLALMFITVWSTTGD